MVSPFLIFMLHISFLFDVGAIFEDFSFLEMFHLAVASFGQYVNFGIGRSLAFGSTGNLIKFFARLPHIQQLEVQSFFLKYLAAGTILGKLPTTCRELIFISIRINFNDTEENLAAHCLMRSSPNLQTLELLACPEEQATARTATNIVGNDKSFPSNQLRIIKIVGISCIRQERSFSTSCLHIHPFFKE